MKLTLTIFICLYSFGILHAQNNLLVQEKPIKIGLTHAPPLIILNNQDVPDGMMVDFLKEVAIQEGWEIEWILGSWTDVYNIAKNGNLDLMTYIAYTPERTEYFNFSRESFITGWGQVYTRDTSLYQNILDYENKRIALVKDDVHVSGIIEKCDKFSVNCQFIYVDDYKVAFEMLMNNEVEGVVSGSTVGRTYEKNFEVFRTSIMYKPTDALFSSPKNNTSEITDVLDHYLKKWKLDPNSPYSLSKTKWMGGEHIHIVETWMYYLLFAIVGLLVLSFFIVSVLRKKIKKHIRKYKNQSKQLNQIINLVPHMIYVVNSEGNVVLLNNYASNYFGTTTTPNTMTYQLLDKMPQFYAFFKNDAELLKKGKGNIFKEVTCNSYQQKELVFNVSKVLFETDDNSSSILTVGVDITEKQNYQNEIKFIAEHDDLTGLPNRLLLKNTLLEDFSSADKKGAVLFIDLDYFKDVNDTLGHFVGDQLLVLVAKRIQTVIGNDAMLARIGGDEFVVYLKSDESNIKSIENYTTSVSRNLIKLISKKFYLNEHSIFISASIGIVIIPRDANSYEQIMRRGDIAMYQAKAKGRNDFVVFQESMENDIFTKQKTIRELHNALENSEFFIEYQPQINGNNNKIIGLEALLRWRHPNGKVIQPNDFISISEECGLILRIGDWVIEEVLKQLSTWLKKYEDIPFVTINLSVLQLRNDEFVDSLKSSIRKYSTPSHLIEFEITESVMIEHLEKTIYTLSQLKNLGIRLSIDDFGTGYSSMSYLKKLPFDKLKIDYSFIKDITTDNDTKTIVKTIIGMSKDLDLDVIAEGVETEKQLNTLKKMGCYKFQGFYFDKPSSVEYIEKKYFNT
ncbi:MAG: EAL domain-containing protein [Proteobacteria bacterium]|nr:EAL domain-containing protein [Pseudomonadota bacterium]